MSAARIIWPTILGMILGTVVLGLVVSHWWPSTVTISHSTESDGMQVHVTEVNVSGPVATAQLIGAMAGGVAGCAIAVALHNRNQRGGHV